MGCVQGCNRNEVKIVLNKNNSVVSEKNQKLTKSIKINNDIFISEKQSKFDDNYITLKELGEGSFGKVFKVKHKSTNLIRAVKIIFKQRILMSKFEEEEIIKEIEILKLLDHPNIIKVYEYFNTTENLYIVLEFCNGGELFDKLIEVNSFSEEIASDIMRQLLSAVCFCHARNIIHRDIKPENVLIESYEPTNKKRKKAFIDVSNTEPDKKNGDVSRDNNINKKQHPLNKSLSNNSSIKDSLEPSKKHVNNNSSKNGPSNSKSNEGKKQTSTGEPAKMEKFTVKIIDFGTSVIKKDDYMKEKTGTAYYIAPEVIKNNYTEKCDIWSLGVILYILLSGEPPFSDEDDNLIFKKILIGKYKLSGKFWDKISVEAKELIKRMLTYDYTQRPSAAEILESDPWIKRYSCNNNTDKLDLKSALINISKFKQSKKIQQAALGYIVHHLSNDKEVDRLRKIFQIIDVNGDGQLTRDELYEGLKRELGEDIAKKEINRIMLALDNDNSGLIEFQEFLRASIDRSKIFTEENLNQAFMMFDIDKSGKITYDEIKQVLGKNINADDDVWKEMIKEFDKSNKDGIVIEDFKKMMLDMDKSQFKDPDECSENNDK